MEQTGMTAQELWSGRARHTSLVVPAIICSTCPAPHDSGSPCQPPTQDALCSCPCLLHSRRETELAVRCGKVVPEGGWGKHKRHALAKKPQCEGISVLRTDVNPATDTGSIIKGHGHAWQACAQVRRTARKCAAAAARHMDPHLVAALVQEGCAPGAESKHTAQQRQARHDRRHCRRSHRSTTWAALQLRAAS